MIKGQARSRDMPVQKYLGNAKSWDKPCKVLDKPSLGAWLRFAYLLDSTIREPRKAINGNTMMRIRVLHLLILHLSALHRLGIFRINFRQAFIP
jgi:hypothetical protein